MKNWQDRHLFMIVEDAPRTGISGSKGVVYVVSEGNWYQFSDTNKSYGLRMLQHLPYAEKVWQYNYLRNNPNKRQCWICQGSFGRCSWYRVGNKKIFKNSVFHFVLGRKLPIPKSTEFVKSLKPRFIYPRMELFCDHSKKNLVFWKYPFNIAIFSRIEVTKYIGW